MLRMISRDPKASYLTHQLHLRTPEQIYTLTQTGNSSSVGVQIKTNPDDSCLCEAHQYSFHSREGYRIVCLACELAVSGFLNRTAENPIFIFHTDLYDNEESFASLSTACVTGDFYLMPNRAIFNSLMQVTMLYA